MGSAFLQSARISFPPLFLPSSPTGRRIRRFRLRCPRSETRPPEEPQRQQSQQHAPAEPSHFKPAIFIIQDDCAITRKTSAAAGMESRRKANRLEFFKSAHHYIARRQQDMLQVDPIRYQISQIVKENCSSDFRSKARRTIWRST